MNFLSIKRFRAPKLSLKRNWNNLTPYSSESSARIRSFGSTSLVLSAQRAATRRTVSDIRQIYEQKVPISMLTAYDSLTSRVGDAANIDITLVGDSLAMTSLGMEDTMELSLEELIFHVRSVSRGNNKSLIIADIPFGAYELSAEQATELAIKIIKQGRAQGVKIEGADEQTLKSIKKIINAGIPVMGHIGLTPQKYNSLGGFKVQGNQVDGALKIMNDALLLQDAGCFAMVLESIPNKLAELITDRLDIPTIGIGAGPDTSGQVLVISDMLGMQDPQGYHRPKFVKQYLDFYDQAVKSVDKYNEEVKRKQFPNKDEHGFKIKSSVLNEIREKI